MSDLFSHSGDNNINEVRTKKKNAYEIGGYNVILAKYRMFFFSWAGKCSRQVFRSILLQK